jgi:glutamine amidotransferase
VNVPTNSILTIHKQTVMVHPIEDRYYAKSPYHIRSSTFVQTKGLISNEKVSANIPTPGATPLPDTEEKRRSLVPTIPFGIPISRSRTPEHLSGIKTSRTPSSLHDIAVPSDRQNPISLNDQNRTRSSPHQGNIGRKRLSMIEFEQQQNNNIDDIEPLTPERLIVGRTEYGNPNKIAQYFPELRISN